MQAPRLAQHSAGGLTDVIFTLLKKLSCPPMTHLAFLSRRRRCPAPCRHLRRWRVWHHHNHRALEHGHAKQSALCLRLCSPFSAKRTTNAPKDAFKALRGLILCSNLCRKLTTT
jgi:hypothetical protein